MVGKIAALALDPLLLGRGAVGHRLANFRIGGECGLDGFAKIDGEYRRCAQHQHSRH